MVRFSIVLLGVWLAQMFASGSVLAVIHDLGVLFPGAALPLFGTPAAHTDFEDVYGFDIAGMNATVGASFVTLTVKPNSPGASATFDVKGSLEAFNGSGYSALSGPITGPALLVAADVPIASGGDPSGANRHYRLVVSGAAADISDFASYGGSLRVAAVPEPSALVILLGGLLALVPLARRKIAAR